MAAALEVRAEFAASLLDGGKAVELRAYELPAAFVGGAMGGAAAARARRERVGPSNHLPPPPPGPRVYLLATHGPPGVPALGESFPEGADGRASLVGWVAFAASRPYPTPDALAADEGLHGVPPGSPYGWAEGGERHGWVVGETGRVEPPAPPPAAAPASHLDLLPHADAGGLYAAMALAYRSLSFSACLA